MNGMNKPEKSFAGLSAGAFVFYAGLGMLAAGAGFLAALLIPGSGPQAPRFDPAAEERQAAAPEPSAGRFVQTGEPQEAPDLAFKSGDGKEHKLSEWRGKVVLVNLWATWCAPCKVEMPSLDRLQAKLGGDAFAVLALSVDRGGPEKPQAFFAGNNIAHLALYNDSEAEATAALRASGLPLSVVLGADGREVARLIGPSDWDSPASIAKIEEFIKRYGKKG
jgi:thiol-disulfide isomerase/thioredoxin